MAVRVVTDEVIAKKLSVSEEMKIGSPEKRIGITIYDEVTGEPYCLKMRNGVMASDAGECLISPELVPEAETEPASPDIGMATSTEL